MTQRVYSLLLVDDEEANRLLLARLLRQDNYMVTGAENGQQVLDLMRVEHFDLVLMDVLMPVMDGMTTLSKIKSDSALKNVPVVMLSAANDRAQIIRCLGQGAADYLIKPVNPVELKQRVKRCLDTHAARVELTMRVEVSDLTGARILIVDDEPLNIKLLEMRLKQLGFKTLTATNGQEALDILGRVTEEPIDAVLLDVQMNGLDGFAVLGAIRADEKWNKLAALMLSSDGKEETITRCYQLGADDYLVKPFHTTDLQMRLSVALDIRRSKPQ